MVSTILIEDEIDKNKVKKSKDLGSSYNQGVLVGMEVQI